MADTFFLRPSDPAFRKHRGTFPLVGAEQALLDYEAYVVQEGRNVPKDLWMGTSVQEGGLGKYVFGGPGGGKGRQKYLPPKLVPGGAVNTENPMMGLPPREYLESRADRFAPNWRSTVDPNTLVINSSDPVALRNYISDRKRRATEDAMSARGLDLRTDYAAQKLHEGMSKFRSPEKASRWYNYYDPVPRERLPGLGRDVLANPQVQEIMKRLQGNASY